MTNKSSSYDIFTSSYEHLSVLDEFVEITQRTLEQTSNAFARDSLTDLLGNLNEQRASYVTFADPVVNDA